MEVFVAGCGKCPNCDEAMDLFSNNVLFGWTCLACGNGGIGEQPPSACPHCGKGRVEDRVARIPDICICMSCRTLLVPKPGEFTTPTVEELSNLPWTVGPR